LAEAGVTIAAYWRVAVEALVCTVHVVTCQARTALSYVYIAHTTSAISSSCSLELLL